MDRITLVSLVCALVFAQCNGLVWKDCGSKKGKVTKVTVPGCEKTTACQLHKGTNVTFTVDFTPSEAVTKATAVVHGVIGPIPIPFPIDNPDGCKDSGLTCPLAAGAAVTYSTTLSVKSEYPSLKVIVEWELRDQNNDDLFCIKLPAQITDAPKDNNTKQDDKLYFKPRA